MNSRSVHNMDTPSLPHHPNLHYPRTEAYFWFLALFFWVIGDVVTTIVGITSFGLSEANLIPIHVISIAGLGALIPFKVISTLPCILAYKLLPKPFAYIVPIEMTVLSSVVVVSNLYQMALAV